MASCSIRTPDANIDAAFGRLPPLLARYKVGTDRADAWAPGVAGYGIDEACPAIQDTRDNRWMVWAARYCERDDAFLAQTLSTILQRAFGEDGRELHERRAPDADDYLHYYVWWLLQIALGYLYTGDVSLDAGRLRKIVEVTYRLFDREQVGMLHTQSRCFVTSIGEPFNTDPGQAYGFFQNCNLAFSLEQFAALARAQGDQPSRRYFEDRLSRLRPRIASFRDAQGFYCALKGKASGAFRYRVSGPDSFSLLTDNVFFPLAFGVLSPEDLKASLDYLLPVLDASFPVPYGHPPYRGEGTAAWWIPRSWQEPLAHYCLALRELGMPDRIYRGVKRQADRISLDDEVWEHYDPETGSPHGYHVPARRGYSTTIACLAISIVEGLFGLRPESPGFAKVSIKPAFPEDWRSASIDTTVNGRRVAYTMSSTDREVRYDFAGSSALPAALTLPLPSGWQESEIEANVDGRSGVLAGEARPCFSAEVELDRAEVVIRRAGGLPTGGGG